MLTGPVSSKPKGPFPREYLHGEVGSTMHNKLRASQGLLKWVKSSRNRCGDEKLCRRELAELEWI